MKKQLLLIILGLIYFTSYSQVVIMPARTIISTPTGIFGSAMATHISYAKCCDYVEITDFYDDYCQLLQNKAFADFGENISLYNEERFEYLDEEELFDVSREEVVKFEAEKSLFSNKKLKQTGEEIGEISKALFEKSKVKYIVYTTVLALKNPSEYYEKKENEFLGSLSAFAWIIDCETGMIVAEVFIRNPTGNNLSSSKSSSYNSMSPKYSRINSDDYKRINNKMFNRIKRKLNRLL